MSWSFIRETFPVARKKHQCIWCGEFIEKGEKHNQYVGTMDGEFQDNRVHMECHAAMTKLQALDPFALEEFNAHDHPRGCFCDGYCSDCIQRRDLKGAIVAGGGA